ncbi:hypothetical protein BJY01DRAFT_201981 [Aspergillus pseudoustus]|uniref:Secreted protein n=1 Tax=Aspergillus pseudoustus TaxID=1810923 RepID=A0ABR4KZU3_9EURO
MSFYCCCSCAYMAAADISVASPDILARAAAILGLVTRSLRTRLHLRSRAAVTFNPSRRLSASTRWILSRGTA